MGNALEFKQQTGLSTALRVHDELVYVVPEDAAEEKLALMQSIMRTPPTWWPELVVWSEGGRGDTYGSCK
jgi:DNA polymerase I-like protein with 3'-5' exonuclease and polymerase domains